MSNIPNEDFNAIFAALTKNGITIKGEALPVSDETTTTANQQREAVLATLASLGRLSTGDDSLVFQGTKFVLPENYHNDVEGAVKFLRQYDEQQNTEHGFNRRFPYRPFDGAAAFDRALKRVFNHAGIGRAQYTMFGKRPPEFLTVPTGVETTIQVPWGTTEVSQLQAEFHIGSSRSAEHGIVFAIQAEAPRKYRAHIEAFFDVVEDELRTRSLYKGKAINGAKDPGFLDLSTVDPSRVIYNKDVLTNLGANLWTLIERSEMWKEMGVNPKRSVLLSGTYGTGKTLAGYLTAQRAVANGFTFILCRSGKDDLFRTLETAQLYSPSVVWFEDIDVIARDGDPEDISRLLDSLDGISTKGKQVLAGFTTNHVEELHPGLLRPGRIDAVINIGTLDAEAIEKLVKRHIPSHLLSDEVDYEKVAEALAGFTPAFYVETIERALRYMVERTGSVDTVTTDDLVSAAAGMRPQHELMLGANSTPSKPTLDQALRDAVAEAVADRVGIDGGPAFAMREDDDDE